VIAKSADFQFAPGVTIETARRALSGAFRAAQIDSAEPDARILIGHALSLDRAALAAQHGRILKSAEIHALTRLVQRRLAHEPVARILGNKEFWGLTFALSPATLVPRPDTETVVEAALAAISDRKRALRICDLGTGSGCLLLALLHECKSALGYGTDRSVSALTCARENAHRNGLESRSHFIACDFADALAGTFDCVVSNPPYIPSGEIETLAPDVRDFDPHLALDGGPDGLSAYRRIAADVSRLLRPGAALVIELGAGQEEAVTAIMAANGLKADSAARRDLAGMPRALTLRLSP
jgi:release factor glutamine methyltransferase